MCYVCTYMCMHIYIYINVIYTNRNYSFTKLQYTLPREFEQKRKDLESGQPTKRTEKIAAVEKR